MDSKTNDIIRIGGHVRSYDFPDLDGMKRSCYVEGIVEAIGQVPEVSGCDRYTIRITRRVWKNQEDDGWKQGKEFPTGYAHPPVNGTNSWLGGVTGGVKLLPPEIPPEPADPHDQPPRLTWSQLVQGRKVLVSSLEKHLREKGWPYVAVDEAKKAIFNGSNIDAFDYLLYSSSGKNLLVLIVTRHPTPAQVDQMRQWEQVFGNDFLAAFTFRVGEEWRTVSLADLEDKNPLALAKPLAECL